MYEELIHNDDTELIYDELCFGDIIYLRKDFDNMLEDIDVAIELDERKAFVEGLVKHLSSLGCDLETRDTDGLLAEVKKRYKNRMGITVPRTVQEWIRGTVPGTVNRRNNYELCYALEMDVKKTAEFFIKCYMTVPYNYKDSIDAIFYYCILNKRPYEVICNMIEVADTFIAQNNDIEDTVIIGRNIAEIDSDEEFLTYISQHCYNNEQQYQVARNKIREMVMEIKDLLGINDDNKYVNTIVDNIYDFSYQKNIQKNLKERSSKRVFVRSDKLPKRFVESIPRNGVMGDILKGKKETYETLRKTIVILYFYIFFFDVENVEEEDIRDNALDFYDELNQVLFESGFAPIYVRHPFDYLMIFCAISPEPLETFSQLNKLRYTGV